MTSASRWFRAVPTPAAAVVALLMAASMTACSSVEPDSGAGKNEDNFGKPPPANLKSGGALTVALASEPDKLDPSLGRSLVGRQVFHAMCEKLYDLDQNVEVQPQLASDLPDVSDDGLTVTIPLRDGIEFADGTPFNAAAVKQSLDRHVTMPESARVSELGPIDEVTAEDDQTVVIKLKKPFAPLTAALADRAGMVMSPKALNKLGDDFSSAPVCVGPFKFEKRVPQSSIELVKDPNYYDADKVKLDRLEYRIVVDASIRAANLQSDDIQVADTVSTQDAADLAGKKGLEVLQSNSLGYQGITFNTGNVKGLGEPPGKIDTPLASDPRVRQAFEHAIDREAISTRVFNGYHRPACSPISPETAYTSDRAQECRDHDPAKAKKLLKQAGVKTPFKIKMSVTNTPDTLRLAQALQAMVKDGGFDLSIEPVEFSTLLDQQDRGDFEAIQIGWSGRVDPDANITQFIYTQGSQNVGGYSDSEVDELLDTARGQQDPDDRAKTYAEMIDKVQDDNPLVYLYRQRNLTGVSTDIGGVQVFQDGIIRVAFAGQMP
ncbi:MAG: ABC transporter substrate-binding protein [Micromonosporaceae bacterium]